MRQIVIALVLLCTVLAACGGGPERKAEAPAAELPPAAVDRVNGGTLTGKVAFIGRPPAMPEVDMSANPTCARAHPKPARSEEVIVNRNQTLKNVLVRISSGLKPAKWETPSTAVVMDQRGCVYVPHVIAVMAGQPVEFRNSDNTNHNVHPIAEVNPTWNETQPPQGDPKLKAFAREEIPVIIKCNVHPWMRAYVGVVAHPFFAVTGDDGTFTIEGVPPGTYTLETWHEKYGRREQPVTVAPKETKPVEFSYAAGS